MSSPPTSLESPLAPALARALRLHQWSKNALVFLPVVAAHRLWDGTALGRAALAFLAFGLLASSAYVLNDVLDAESDRRHPRKMARPFASGALPRAAGLVLAPALLAGSAAVSALLPPVFSGAVASYLVTTVGYSLGLKRLVIVDVLILAALYTLRIYAGSLATGVPVSEWLASFSLFFFLSLALLKRTAEIGATRAAPPGRGYRPEDRMLVAGMGLASGYVAVLVLALYLNNPDVTRLYAQPRWLWAVCVLALYWISRVWLLAWRGEVHDDPVVFAMRDPASWVVAGIGAGVLYLGS